MAMQTLRIGSGRTVAAVAPEPAKFKPVKLWAGVGAAFLAMIAYSVTAWIVSGKATRTPVGPDPVPTYMKDIIHGWEILGIPVLAVFLYFLLVRPWRREGHITTDGLFCFAFFLLWWQDPLCNWLAPYFTTNSEFFNLGNWSGNVPGWFMPNSNLVGEPPIWSGAMYIYAIFGVTLLGSFVLRRIKARRPQIGTFGLILGVVGFFIVFDLLFEPPLMLMGLYTYPATIDWLTLFPGHYYQFPVYQALLWGGTWSAWSCLHYFRNDKGQTIAERGIDEVRATPRQKTWLRFLAIVGVSQMIFLVAYNVPIQFFIVNSSPWPKDIQTRSYFQQNLCGEGTNYQCWGPDIPYPRGTSPHLGPDGELVR